MIKKLDKICSILLNVIFLPQWILVSRGTIYIYNITGMAIASYIYWPEKEWLIFVVCACVPVAVFKTLSDMSTWFRS